MKRSAWSIFLLVTLLPSLFAAQEGRFMRTPAIHADRIVFTYENDLWLVGSSGGPARRITSAPGAEYAATFSPDGKWIAFTGTYDGMPSVYLIPSDGGEPQRLTYVPGGVQTVGWTPDGERIVFRTAYEQANSRDPNLYFVQRTGSAPVRFPMERGTLCSFSPDGKEILYCRKGMEEYYWKRYKGGRYVDIWRYNFTTRAFTPVSDYVGKNAYPMWIGSTMYFASDRGTGVTNLFAQPIGGGPVRQVTSYDDVDVMMPSTDGTTIVYLHDGYLHTYAVAAGETKKLKVEIPSDRWLTRERHIVPKEYIHAFSPSNDGSSVAIEARGPVRGPDGDGGDDEPLLQPRDAGDLPRPLP
jgi:tricorn protease